jgi:hypothetical protein
VYVENKLFATLDPTTRRLRFPREREAIITDTVGFLRDLPRDLMDAFRATLEELRNANLLLHVIDIGHPRFEDQMAAVEKILEELALKEIPLLRVFNKDGDGLLPPEEWVSFLFSLPRSLHRLPGAGGSLREFRVSASGFRVKKNEIQHGSIRVYLKPETRDPKLPGGIESRP